MLKIHSQEEWVRTGDIISLADLTLRWPYYAIFYIPHMICSVLPLQMYIWKEEAVTPAGDKFHRLMPIDRRINYIELFNMMPFVVFLREQIEKNESMHGELQASTDLKPGEPDILLATSENLALVLSRIIFAVSYIHNNKDADIHRALLNKMNNKIDPENDLLTKIIDGDQFYKSILPSEKIRPTFVTEFKTRRFFTTYELAKEFVRICHPNNDEEIIIVAIEVDRRFPGLNNMEFGLLFSASGDSIQEDSVGKNGYRLRKKIYKYKKVPFDHPVH